MEEKELSRNNRDHQRRKRKKKSRRYKSVHTGCFWQRVWLWLRRWQRLYASCSL